MRHTKSTSLKFAIFLAIFVFGLSAIGQTEPCAQLSFRAPSYFENGFGTNGLAKGDLNGDGKVDLVAANENSGTVMIHFGDGNGSLPTSIQLSTESPAAVAISDFNRDGRPDIVVANRASNQITVWLNLGGGAFGVPVEKSVGPGPAGVATGDFNNDGNIDIVATNAGGGTISLLLGTAAGSFPTATSVLLASRASGSWGIVTGDFNADGNLDAATANRGTGNISVLLGNGAGGLVSTPAFGAVSEPFGIAAGDFNSDGTLDLVYTDNGGDALAVRFNNGSGSFPTVTTLAAGSMPAAVATDDLDNDGHRDIVFTNQASSHLSVYRGNGNGSFADRMDFAVGSGQLSLAVADLNGDGAVDLATGLDAGVIGVLLSNCGSSTNTAPVISGASLIRQQGGGVSNSVIAMVADAEQPPSSLLVTVNGAVSASVNGVNVMNIAIGPDGNVTADVSATCGASDAIFTVQVSDSEGLSAIARLDVHVSAESIPPVINNGAPIPNVTVYLPPHTAGTSMPVDFDLPAAADNCTASPQVTSSPASGSMFDLGSTTVTVTARDEAGNISTVAFAVNVMFNFSGFGPLLRPLPEANVAIAGTWIPVNFSLNGYKGLNVLAPGYPKSSPVPCTQNVPGSALESTQTPGNIGLLYVAPIDRYLYVWKTKTNWRHSCRILTLKLTDGSEHHVKIKFL